MTGKKQEKYNNPLKATLTGIMDLFKKHEQVGELKDSDSLDRKRVMITGASSGLGFATTAEMAKRGAEVIMACRSGIPQKGEEVKNLSGSKKVHMLHVDLSDAKSVKDLVNNVRQEFKQIDILICNAAIVPKKSKKTPQGLEQMFMVNYFAKFLLVNLLIYNNCFRKKENNIPRIIFVTSESHRNPRTFDLEGFGEYHKFGIGKVMERYSYYKLLLVTFANELSRRLNKNNKTEYSVFALCPGPVNTNIAREAPAVFQPLLKLIFRLFFKSPHKACEPVVYLACSEDVEGKSIDYLFLMSRKSMDEKATDSQNGRLLWEESELLKERINL